jgi:hypothetical protein
MASRPPPLGDGVVEPRRSPARLARPRCRRSRTRTKLVSASRRRARRLCCRAQTDLQRNRTATLAPAAAGHPRWVHPQGPGNARRSPHPSRHRSSRGGHRSPVRRFRMDRSPTSYPDTTRHRPSPPRRQAAVQPPRSRSMLRRSVAHHLRSPRLAPHRPAPSPRVPSRPVHSGPMPRRPVRRRRLASVRPSGSLRSRTPRAPSRWIPMTLRRLAPRCGNGPRW